MRSSCINFADLQIIGLVEAHILGGYRWFGNNRKSLHVNAKVGSGGVGFLVRNDILDRFNVSVLDDEYEGILWLKLQSTKSTNDCFCMCVCYLPPENSRRAVNVNEFFDTLITLIYTHQTFVGFLFLLGSGKGCGL